MYTAYIGTYNQRGSAGIYQVQMEDGARITGTIPTQNPSYLAVLGDTLYATNETKPGEVVAFRILEIGVKKIHTLSSGGSGPCHILAEQDAVYIANYNDGVVTIYARNIDGSLGAPAQWIAHRREHKGAHAHQCLITPDSKYLAVCDLGMDAVMFYEKNAYGGVILPGVPCAVPPGTGPRHAAFGCNGIWYVLGEFSCDVLIFNNKQLVGQQPLSKYGNHASALRISPDGTLLLASIRGENKLVLCDIDSEGMLSTPRFVDCGGEWPRDAAFTPDGKYVWCACEHSDQLTIFEVYGNTLALRETLMIPCPVCIIYTKL